MINYANHLDLLQDEFTLLDLRIQLFLSKRQEHISHETPNIDILRGVAITEEEVQSLLHAPFETSHTPTTRTLQEQIQTARNQINQKLHQSHNIFFPVIYIQQVFQLDELQYQCFIATIAAQIDSKYAKIFAFLQDDITRKEASLDLFFLLFTETAHERWNLPQQLASHPYWYTYLIDYDNKAEGDFPRRNDGLRIHQRILSFIRNPFSTNLKLKGFTRLSMPSEPLEPLIWESEIPQQLQDFISSLHQNPKFQYKQIAIQLLGPPKSGKKLQVQHLCGRLDIPVLIVDLERAMGESQEWPILARDIVREAMLQQAALCLTNLDKVFTDHEQHRHQIAQLLNVLDEWKEPLFLLSEQALPLHSYLQHRMWMKVNLQTPNYEVRESIWKKISRNTMYANSDFGAFSGKFNLTIGQMKAVIEEAEKLHLWHHQNFTDEKSETYLHQACLEQLNHSLMKKAKRIVPRADWNKLILPVQQVELLQQACAQMNYRHIVFGEWGFEERLSYGKGLSMLFSGPPGTGKTMSAEVIAKELSLELYRIDLSQMISKYIGETEKNLHELFEEATKSQAILFFDEADALFGKRSEVKDAHDKYANVETAYLLQKLEEYEGVTILATNFQQNIDEAFSRRFSYVIKFPFPDEWHREKIWKSMLPENLCDPSIDFALLAKKFQLSGGNIKNIVVNAAFLAAQQKLEQIHMGHVIKAIKQELEKSGGVLLRSDLSEFIEWL